MKDDPVVRALLVAILATCIAMIVVGVRTGRPPGQRGLKGTPLAGSRALQRLQLALLVVLAAGCVAGLWMTTA